MSEESRLVSSISDRQFELYALSLERGPDFDPQHIFAAYKVGRGSAAGCILLDADTGTFATLALRRRVDHVRVLVDQAGPFPTPEAALHHRSAAMRGGDAPETLPPGAGRRKLLIQPGARGISPEFELLTSTVSHLPALMAVGECYLALPNPDPNFVSDLQTNNFASRLFELYLLACFPEQGLIVQQDHVSPDFWIEKNGKTAWVEAVTANSETPRSGGIGDWVHAPTDKIERLSLTYRPNSPALELATRRSRFLTVAAMRRATAGPALIRASSPRRAYDHATSTSLTSISTPSR